MDSADLSVQRQQLHSNVASITEEDSDYEIDNATGFDNLVFAIVLVSGRAYWIEVRGTCTAVGGGFGIWP